MALAACATNGMTDGGMAAPVDPAAVAEEARIARAVLPTQTPRAALLQPWTGGYDGLPPFDRVTPAALRSKVSGAPNPNRLFKSAWLNRFMSAAVDVMPPAAYTHDGCVADGN